MFPAKAFRDGLRGLSAENAYLTYVFFLFTLPCFVWSFGGFKCTKKKETHWRWWGTLLYLVELIVRKEDGEEEDVEVYSLRMDGWMD